MIRPSSSLRPVTLTYWFYFVLSIICVLGGIYLTFIGATGQVDLEIAGVKINTAVPGVIFGVLGFLIIRLTLDTNKKLVGATDAATNTAKELLAPAADAAREAAEANPDLAGAVLAIDEVVSTDLPDQDMYAAALEGKRAIDSAGL